MKPIFTACVFKRWMTQSEAVSNSRCFSKHVPRLTWEAASGLEKLIQIAVSSAALHCRWWLTKGSTAAVLQAVFSCLIWIYLAPLRNDGWRRIFWNQIGGWLVCLRIHWIFFFCVKIVSARCHLEGDDAVLLLMDYSQKKEFLLHFILVMPSLSF